MLKMLKIFVKYACNSSGSVVSYYGYKGRSSAVALPERRRTLKMA